MRKIIHIDMDCFYAAIEMRDDPSLRERPIAVGGRPDRRGVIATANYVARRFGVHSAMASARAVRLCPQLLILPTRMSVYRQESAAIRDIFCEYTDLIEPLSLDEAYLDVTGSDLCRGSATLIADQIRRRIKEETGLTASAGVAPNKFLAKVASDIDKPDGLTVIPPGQILDFVARLPVEAIPGVGRVTTKRLNGMGLRTCADLREWPLDEMLRRFGKRGRRLYYLARGIDERPLRVERIPKSISVENTYAEDLPDADACVARIPELLEDLLKRFGGREDPPPIRGLFVKVKFDDFRQTTLERSEYRTPRRDAYETLMRQAIARHGRPVRLLGIGLRLDAEGVGAPTQLDLFR
jgi:DNA polymerase IV